VSAPLGYGLAWDLIRWAQGEGAEWFDFGGIPNRAEHAPELEGVVRFKEAFGGEPVDYREEWELRSRPLMSRLQRLVATGARAVARRRA
jgi:lipid II:glycine glycyltransferase (peptidoglycan interpeptide bridge formation enzyme)